MQQTTNTMRQTQEAQAQEEQAKSSSLFGDFSKLIGQFKLPGIDLDAILEGRRKDIEALAAANQSALEGIQSLSKKQAEILLITLDELQSLVKHRTSSEDATASASTSEAVKHALERAFANMRELAEVAYKGQSEAFAIISQRIRENIQELKALKQPTK